MAMVQRRLRCTARLEPARRGRPRLSCSERCRSRLRRWRESLPAADPGAALLEDLCHVPRDPDEAVLRELLALQGSVLVLRRVARRARPAVASRPADIAAVLEGALRKHFGGVIGGGLREALAGAEGRRGGRPAAARLPAPGGPASGAGGLRRQPPSAAGAVRPHAAPGTASSSSAASHFPASSGDCSSR